MYDVVIIGGSLSGLIAAIDLSKFFKVCIIDINQEIGFPTNFPGMIEEIDLLSKTLVNPKHSKLYLKKNKIGWGLRSEWLIKYLTQLSAKNGVEILNRTRVTNIFYNDFLNLEIIGGGPKNKLIKTRIIIDESHQIHYGPGELNHIIKIDNKNIISVKNNSIDCFVGIMLSNTAIFNNSLLKIEREDGLTEVWFETQPDITPTNGWIEIKNCKSPYFNRLMIIDDYYNNSKNLIDLTKKHLT